MFADDRLANPNTRGDIKRAAADVLDEQGLADFISGVFVWGAGSKSRFWPSKLRSLVAWEGNVERLRCLCIAAQALHPADAYSQLKSDSSRVYGLGSSYGTKVLYFAGYTTRPPGNKPLILDKRVAKSIRLLAVGNDELFAENLDFQWSVEAYAAYIEIARDAAERLANQVGIKAVETDGIEYALFRLGGWPEPAGTWRDLDSR